MTAFSDSVSTTLKFSMVATGEAESEVTTRRTEAYRDFCYENGHTLPVVAVGRVPEVVAHLVSRHTLHRVRGLERVQYNAVFLHFPPVNLHASRKSAI